MIGLVQRVKEAEVKKTKEKISAINKVVIIVLIPLLILQPPCLNNFDLVINITPGKMVKAPLALISITKLISPPIK